MDSAIKIRKMYMPGFEFPEWVIDEKHWDNHKFDDTIVFCNKHDSIEDVELMITQREPCNISNRRLYDENKLKETFGWDKGAYSLSTKDKLMPNISIYCNATVKTSNSFINVHVINLVGFAFDSYTQPDNIYFNKKPLDVLVSYNKKMWEYAFVCALKLKKENKINKINIYNVGGGAFAGEHKYYFIEKIFEPSFLPLVELFKKYNIEILGYNFEKKQFNGGPIPYIFDNADEKYEDTLYVNAWDPWSLIGNGNSGDRSLDGAWGRCSNMSVLGWSLTNNKIKIIQV